MRDFRFWSWLRSPEDLSAADTEASRRTREKSSLVPRVILEIKLALGSFKFKMSSIYSLLGGLQLYFYTKDFMMIESVIS